MQLRLNQSDLDFWEVMVSSLVITSCTAGADPATFERWGPTKPDPFEDRRPEYAGRLRPALEGVRGVTHPTPPHPP